MDALLPRSRCLVLATVVAALGLGGCVPVAYVHPRVHHLAVKDTAAPDGDVYVFHETETRRTHGCRPADRRAEIAPVSTSHDGKSAGYTNVTMESGLMMVSVLTHGIGTNHTARLKLYRPGYKLAVVEAPEKTLNTLFFAANRLGMVRWEPAETLLEQEGAIDDLLELPEGGQSEDGQPSLASGGLDAVRRPADVPGGGPDGPAFGHVVQSRHPKVLRLAAAEYDRLADAAARERSEGSQNVEQVGYLESLDGPSSAREDPVVARLRGKASWARQELD